MPNGTSRRQFISTVLAFGLTSAAAYSGDNGPIRLRGVDSGNTRNHFKRLSEELYSDEDIRDTFARDVIPDGGYPADQAIEDNEYYDPALLPPPESSVDFAIEPLAPGIILPQFRVQSVQFAGDEEPGTLVVVPQEHFLYHVTGYQLATRYGVGVGRAGFTWSGEAVIQLKRRWPRWVPPRGMVDRDPRARKWVNGQPGGPENPLGARALYLYQNNRDTLYRIHGTNEPNSIGKSVSSGCIRMLNQDIAALYEQVKIGTKVVVRSSEVNNSLVGTES